MSNIGVNVKDFAERATPGVVAASTSIAGFVIWADAGPENQIVEITSHAQFLRVFVEKGAAAATSSGALALRGFFDNGGARARVVGLRRPAAQTATPPSPDVEAERAAQLAAIDLFERASIQLLVLPDSDDSAVALHALAHAASMGERFYIGHLPAGLDLAGAQKAADALRGDIQFGAVYYPWIEVIGPDGAQKACPPCGHVAGIYARTAQERGIWKAPAGNAASVRGAVGVTADLSDVEHTALVTEHGACAIRALPGRGVVVDSARSLSTNSKWLFVNVRLLMNFIKASLKQNLDWAKYEPNDAALWGRIKHNAIVPFLMGLWRRGAFGSGEPADLFTVVVDETNNSAADIDQGLLNIVVTFYPSRPAETIVIQIGQQDAGTTITEA